MRIEPKDIDFLYKELKYRIVSRREEFDQLTDFLENKTEWLQAPASTKYHLAIEKGLLIHSIGVAYQLLKIKDALLPGVSDESCIICGLFHDIGKLGTPEHPLYKKAFNGYYYNPDTITMGLGVRSLFLVSQFIPLLDDEAQAICYHDGQYIPENEIIAHKETPLALLLHYADYWQAHMYEDERRYNKYIKAKIDLISC